MASPASMSAYPHVQKVGHPFTLNVKRKRKPTSHRSEDEEPPAKMTKIAIDAAREEDQYDHTLTLKCWKCDPNKGVELSDALSRPQLKALADGIMQSMSSARQSEVKAWEEEIIPCEHTLTLQQTATGPIQASGLAHCASCDLKENLWLCLSCGSLGCGRQQAGGLPGNGHALAHYNSSGHGVNVKLGTITPDGNADIFCYACDDAKQDLDLVSHLSTFGINIQVLKKTEKSMTELQLEQNLSFDFSLTDESGKALEPVFGPGLTGLSNLGNSCYIASVLQTIFSLPAFQTRYYDLAKSHYFTCPISLPADCVECQMYKIGDGLLSGRYSRPANYAADPKATNPLAHDSPTPVFQEGVKPTGFKALIGKGHEEFATMKQQDAEEFFIHLLTVLRRDAHKYKERSEPDATAVFSYGLEQRLQCSDCKKVRYRIDTMDTVSINVPATEKSKDDEGKVIYEDVPLWQCIEALLGTEALEYSCPSCQKTVHALKSTKFASFPSVLVIHAKKFQLVNWVPSKLNIPLILPENDELMFTQQHFGQGLQGDEQELPKDAPALPQFNEAALSQLESMGFPTLRCQKALLATGNDNPEAAMEWLFNHMEDPDIDAPIQTAASSGSSVAEPSAEQINMLADMGFTPAQARKALRETSGNAERAVEWLFNHPDDMGDDGSAQPTSTDTSSDTIPGSKVVPARYRLKAFISHKGPSARSGHYVAHIRVSDTDWLLFNDEKVVKADAESVAELKKLAYLYIFELVA
ncbi:hypothetical protein ONZ45_g14725 [Pleurotus djamor]|nr:hypothetical protein ONZ45_g14725 [Pleurotus djamor]